jgi:hypothetical protein
MEAMMWLVNVLLLWLVPITLGLVVFDRMAKGAPPLNHAERQMLFDETKISELTPWLAIKFIALAMAFLGIGVIEGVILPNLHFIWKALISVLTGGAATLLVALWLRSGSEDPWDLRDKMVRRNSGKRRPIDGFSIR